MHIVYILCDASHDSGKNVREFNWAFIQSSVAGAIHTVDVVILHRAIHMWQMCIRRHREYNMAKLAQPCMLCRLNMMGCTGKREDVVGEVWSLDRARARFDPRTSVLTSCPQHTSSKLQHLTVRTRKYRPSI
jgi:hypothetical protein